MKPPLARSTVDRAAHRRTDDAWLARAWESARVLVVDEHGKALVDTSGEVPALVFVDAARAPAGERLFLGEDGDERPAVAYFAVPGELPAESEDLRARDLRAVGADLSARDSGLLVTAVALVNWHAASGFSPINGARTRIRSAGWVRRSDQGGQVFPRTDPAMIVLVSDGVPGPGGQALLGRQAVWPAGRYSTLAGFVEPGESVEAAVIREVAEEAGVTVRRPRYVASQPWPFPASLMLGFEALGDPAQPIRRADEELEDARWFTRAQIREAVAGGGDLLMPTRTSIAYHLITGWLDRD